MQDKFEMFEELPVELDLETAQNLTTCDLESLAQTSQYHLALFKPMADVRTLLNHVVCGRHDAVLLILTDNINLMFKRGKVTDCSGREFENISGFEYALWALDKHLWAKMIACIPQNEAGRKEFVELVDQYNKVNRVGVTYKLNGKTITEQHFDFKNTIIIELQMQVDSINAPGYKNWDAIDNQWRKGVGGAQKMLPMHIVDEYCYDEPINPVPRFISQPKSSKQFYNFISKKDENWFHVDSKLGSEFAIFKGPQGGFGVTGLRGYRVFVHDDLDAMRALCEVRAQDLINLKSQLEEQTGLDNHSQVVPM